ncbi:MAG: hypothetical protein EA362_00460 [Saprospirales bacterium]|nr:MAG: hypothetical protein EA362_00460 [Saprospirales bacterium]
MIFITNYKFIFFLISSAFILFGIAFTSCSDNGENIYEVFHIEVSASLDEDNVLANHTEYLPLLELFNNTNYVYYYSDSKHKLIHNLNLGDQQFKSIETYQEGKVGEYRFIEYLGSRLKMKNTKKQDTYKRGIDWDIVEIKDRQKDFLGYKCNFAEGFSIIDGVEYTISGYICPNLMKHLKYIQPTEIMEIDAAWIEANVQVEGLNLKYKIGRTEKINKEEISFPDPANYELVDYDDEFTAGFTNWLQN